jgi:hypothetical protein
MKTLDPGVPLHTGSVVGQLRGGNFTRDYVEQVVTIRRHSLLGTTKDM